MTEQVVVLGSGYAGAGSVRSLESALDDEADITWISDRDYHLVLHETHRCISDPSVQENVTIPIDEIKSPATTFMHATVENIDTDERVVHLESGDTIEYDYLLVGIGSRTAYFGIDGLRENAHTLKSLDDALGIHEHLVETARTATQTDPGQIVIGGAGISGIQTAGEVAEFRDDRNAPLEITLVEGLETILPGSDPGLQAALQTRLNARGIHILTGKFINETDEETVHIGQDEELEYDVLIWTGGITGQDAIRDVNIEKDERDYRLKAAQTFQTNNERVFAIGDAALIEQQGGEPAPPTAQSAWQAAEVAGTNIARAIRGQPLKNWTFDDKGTVISIGEDAVAHNVFIVPFIDTFGGMPARKLKKVIATRWINDLTGLRRAIRAWPDM